MVCCANQNIPVAKRQFHNVPEALVQEPRHRSEAVLVRPDEVANLDGQHRFVAGVRPNKRVARDAARPARVHEDVEPGVDGPLRAVLEHRNVGAEHLINAAAIGHEVKKVRAGLLQRVLGRRHPPRGGQLDVLTPSG
jgi:hypothetical protein